MCVSGMIVAVEACTNLADQLTQRRQEAKTQRAGRWEGKDGLESLTQRMKLLRNPNPCVSAPLRLCVGSITFKSLEWRVPDGR
jgi:hypothetical protein